MRKIFGAIRQLGGRSIGIALLILGLLYFWPDIQGLPAAYGFAGWGEMMPDRETVAFVLLALAMVWIVWIDVRPTLRRWIAAHKKHPLTIVHPQHPWVVQIIHTGPSKSDPVIYEYCHQVLVRNDTDRTLRNVEMEGELGGQIGPVPIEGTDQNSVDIRPGGVVHFEIGTVFSLNDRPVNLMPRFGPPSDYKTAAEPMAKMADDIFFLYRNGIAPVGIHVAGFEKGEKPINTMIYQVIADDITPLKLVVTIVENEVHGFTLNARVIPKFGDIERI